MESALYGVYTLVVLYQKSHSFASLTCSISDTPQLVCKHRTRALCMNYSIFIELVRKFNTLYLQNNVQYKRIRHNTSLLCKTDEIGTDFLSTFFTFDLNFRNFKD